jgi:hypothetical protein
LSETDFTEDLKKIDVPALFMHGAFVEQQSAHLVPAPVAIVLRVPVA